MFLVPISSVQNSVEAATASYHPEEADSLQELERLALALQLQSLVLQMRFQFSLQASPLLLALVAQVGETQMLILSQLESHSSGAAAPLVLRPMMRSSTAVAHLVSQSELRRPLVCSTEAEMVLSHPAQRRLAQPVLQQASPGRQAASRPAS
jgi:hypothetical protein